MDEDEITEVVVASESLAESEVVGGR